MKLTRIIALGVIVLSVGFSVSNAQTLRQAEPPAEFPPSSFAGKQFVDSRGCIYIRAGIDGNVTWVPRMSRARKQLCGYQPTAVAGGTPARAPARPAAQVITVAPTAAAARPAATAAVAAPRPAPVRAATAPTPVRAATVAVPPATAARPRVVPAPVPGMATATATYRAPAVATYRPSPPRVVAPVSAVPTTAPAIAPRRVPARSGGCDNASAFSRQFINPGARCGPQQEAPVTYGRGWDQSSLAPPAVSTRVAAATLAQATRVVPRHVHANRQNTTNVVVPAGFRPAWNDDRLNPHRAERTLTPAVIRTGQAIPAGYRAVERKDDRLNPRRDLRTALGDAQTDMIWTRTLPRRLVPAAPATQIVILSGAALRSPAENRRTSIFQ